MEVFRCNGLGAGHSWSPSTFCSMATSGTATADCPAKSETSSGPHSPESGEDVGYPPICGSQCQVGAAKERAVKLETALAAMEGMEGPEVESVRASHKRAQKAVQGVPFDIQIKEWESFLARATSHLEELDTKRAVICQNIEMSKKRLEELKASQFHLPFGRRCRSAPVASTDRASEFQSGQQTRRASSQEAMSREDFVPQCNEDMEEWMARRHADFQFQEQMTTPSLKANTVR